MWIMGGSVWVCGCVVVVVVVGAQGEGGQEAVVLRWCGSTLFPLLLSSLVSSAPLLYHHLP